MDRKIGLEIRVIHLIETRREMNYLKTEKEIPKCGSKRQRAVFSQWVEETWRRSLIVFWKNSKTSARNGWMVPCFDNNILVPLVAQKKQGKNHTMWAEFMGISANKAHWWLMTWAVPKSWSPELSKTECLAYQGNGDFGCFKEKRSAIFLEHMKLRTAVISKSFRKSQTYTCPHTKKLLLPWFCSVVLWFLSYIREGFSDGRSCLHCCNGCCGLGLQRPGFYSIISPSMFGSFTLLLWPGHHDLEMAQQSARSSHTRISPVDSFLAAIEFSSGKSENGVKRYFLWFL